MHQLGDRGIATVTTWDLGSGLPQNHDTGCWTPSSTNPGMVQKDIGKLMLQVTGGPLEAFPLLENGQATFDDDGLGIPLSPGGKDGVYVWSTGGEDAGVFEVVFGMPKRLPPDAVLSESTIEAGEDWMLVFPNPVPSASVSLFETEAAIPHVVCRMKGGDSVVVPADVTATLPPTIALAQLSVFGMVDEVEVAPTAEAHGVGAQLYFIELAVE
ncbi:MAG: hypothetical protein RIF41_04705 [Polyangiaceae bacterium]